MSRLRQFLLSPTRFFQVYGDDSSFRKWTVGVPICFVVCYGLVHGSMATKALTEMLRFCDGMVDAGSVLPKLIPPAFATATTAALGYILFLASAAVLCGCIAIILDYDCSFRFLLASSSLAAIVYIPAVLLALVISCIAQHPVLLSCPRSYADLPILVSLSGALLRNSPYFVLLRTLELFSTVWATILIVAATEAHVRWPKAHSLCVGASVILLLGVLVC